MKTFREYLTEGKSVNRGEKENFLKFGQPIWNSRNYRHFKKNTIYVRELPTSFHVIRKERGHITIADIDKDTLLPTRSRLMKQSEREILDILSKNNIKNIYDGLR